MTEIKGLEFTLSNHIVVCYRFLPFDPDASGRVRAIGSGNTATRGERNRNPVPPRKAHENRYDFNIHEKSVKNVILFTGRLKKLITKLFSILS